MNFWILPIMLFMHIVDDYYLQGILASMKQKGWWQKQETYCDKYKNDYKVALCMHACSWTFMIMLPLLLYFRFQQHWLVGLIATVNVWVHAFVDDLKANKKKLNLVQDQTIHLIQILATAFLVPLAYTV
jgi:hypothetical protein